jgi:GNAT superfamily N-acetyltransferase
MKIDRAAGNVSAECERVLRTLPRWFGIETSLREYARDAEVYPTFLASADHAVVGFLTVREHFPESWEVHCIAVQASARGLGIGRRLHDHAEAWLLPQRVRLLQVKTLSAAHPSPEYAQTRAFYARMGYSPLEIFPALWEPGLPVLQLVKVLGKPQDAA